MKTQKNTPSCSNCKTLNKQCSCFDCSICCKSHKPNVVTTEEKRSLITNKENTHSEFICRLSMDIKTFLILMSVFCIESYVKNGLKGIENWQKMQLVN